MKRKFSLLTSLALLLSLVGSFAFSSNASASTDTLTQKQKAQYYQEYLVIAEELREEYPNALTFEVSAIEDFNEADWVEPEQYKEKIIPIINGKIEAIEEEITLFGAGSTPTKHGAVYNSNGQKIGNVVINAEVSTAYDSSLNGQVISGISNVRSYTMDGLSHWYHTGYQPIKKSSRSWDLSVAGKYTTSGVTISDVIIVNYKCSSGGAIYQIG